MPVSTVTLRANPGASAAYAWDEPKDPLGTVERLIDFAPILGDRTITGVSCAAAGVTLAAYSLAGTVVTLILQDGADGTPGRVEVRALCDDGTDEAVAVQQPVVAVLTLTGIDRSEPIYPTLGGRTITFLGRPLTAGRRVPDSTPA